LGHKKILADSSVINHAINYFGEQPLKKEGKEMSKSINILEEYRKGDLDRRLNLFLECPSLRAEFLEIDQSEAVGHSLFETSHQEGP
jgi:hypothetical protein